MFWIRIVLSVVALFVTSVSAADRLPWKGEVFEGEPDAIVQAVGKLPVDPTQVNLYLLWDERVQIFEDHRTRTTTRRVYQIQNREDINNRGTIKAYWTPWNHAKPTMKARVITPDGQVHELDPKTISESSAQNVSNQTYGDSRVLSAPLPAVSVGAVIESEVTLEDKTPFCPAGVIGYLNWQNLSPNRKRYLEVRAPKSVELGIERLGREVDTTIEIEGEEKVWRFERDEPEPLSVIWSYLPTDVPNLSSVVYSTGRSWKDIREYYQGLVEKQIGDADLGELIGDIRAGASGRLELLQRSCGFLGERIRYTGIEFGVNAVVPHKPETTLRRRYGDCKDQAVLLVAMLRELEIDASVALLSVQRVDSLPNAPGLNAFDHVIVHVPKQEGLDETWIDLTSPFSTFGNLPRQDQGRMSLIISDDTDQLTRTPTTTSAENRREQFYTYRYSTDGLAEVEVEGKYLGGSAAYMRTIYSGQSKEQLVAGLYAQAEELRGLQEVISYDVTDPSDVVTPQVRIAYKYTANRASAAEQGQLYTELQPGAAFNYLPREFVYQDVGAIPIEEREHPYFLQPFTFTTTYRLIPPPGFKAEGLPADTDFDIDGFRVTRTIREAKDNSVEYVISVDTGDGLISADKVREFRNEFLAMSGNLPPENWVAPITFGYQPTRVFEGGREAEGIRQMLELAKQQSDSPFYQAELATALLTVGLGEEAREVTDEIVKKNPGAARSHSTRALIHMRNRLGVDLTIGMERDKSLESFERAIQLKPDQPILAYNYAVTLEHNEVGGRYTDEVAMQRAQAIYRNLILTQPFDIALRNYAGLLMHREKTGELRQLVGRFPGRIDLIAFFAASELNTAGVDGADQIVARVAAQDRSTLNSTLALRIRGLRQYDRMREFLRGHPEVQAQRNLQILERREDVRLDSSDPCSALQEMLATWLESGLDPNCVRPFYVNLDDRLVFHDEVTKIPEFFRDVRDAVIQNFGALEVAGDIISFYRFISKEEGDHFVVTAVPRNETEGMPIVTRMVVRDGEGFRLFAEGPQGSELGRRALEAVEAGDLKSAAAWIEPVYQVDKVDVSVFNAFSGSPFARAWYFGKSGDADSLRLASQLLAARSGDPAKNWKALKELRENGSPIHQLQIDRAGMDLLIQSRQFDELLELVEAVEEKYPTARQVLSAKAIALVKLGRLDDAEAVFAKLDKKDPIRSNLDRRLLVRAQGGHDAVYEFLRERAKDSKDGFLFRGLLAWQAIFCGKGGEVIEEAMQAVETALPRNRASYMHTLACVYADAGQLTMAIATLNQVIRARNGVRDPIDDLVLGRIAEHCGMKSAATKYYQRSKESLQDINLDTSCNDLANLWLKRVEGILQEPSDE